MLHYHLSHVWLLCILCLLACDDSVPGESSSRGDQFIGLIRDVGPDLVDGTALSDAMTATDMAMLGDTSAMDGGPCSQLVQGAPGQIQGRNNGHGQAAGICGGQGPETSVEFTAPAAGRWIFDTEGSALNTVLHARSVCPLAETEFACNDDQDDQVHSQIDVLLDAGQTIFVFVDSFDVGGPWVLNIYLLEGQNCQTDQCEQDMRRCGDDGALERCADFDGDGCREFGGAIDCGANEICEDGECADCAGRDLVNDPNNCGVCGHACSNENGSPLCVEGVCQMDCDPGFGDCDHDPSTGCETDVNEPGRCGSCAVLEGIPGGICGRCGSGLWICNGPDAVICQGDRGIDATNACGGCNALPFEVGAACGTCASGIWGCMADEGVQCVDDRGDDARNACGGCIVLENNVGAACGACSDGRYECQGRDVLHCVGAAPANGCGGCGPLANDPGDPCGPCGLDQYACSDNPNEVVCDGITTNICGGCGDVAFPQEQIGRRCGTCNTGRWACSPTDDIVCEGDQGQVVENTCGGCAELDEAAGDPCGPCLLDRVVCIGSDSVACDGQTACPDVECELAGNIGTRRITRIMSPCIVREDASLAAGDTLTLDAGVVLKFVVSTDWNDDRDLRIEGEILANGTPEQPVILTSMHDDTAGGDINDDDDVELIPAPGDWGQVALTGRAHGRLSNVEIRYGGGDNDGRCCAAQRAAAATLNINLEMAPTLEKISVMHSQARGALINVTGGFLWSIQDGVFNSNSGHGLEITGDRAPVALSGIECSQNGQNGLVINTHGQQTLSALTVQQNGEDGVVITTPSTLDLSGSSLSQHPGNTNLVITAAGIDSRVRGNVIEANNTVIAADHERVVSVIPNLVQEVADNNALLQTDRGFFIRDGVLNIDAIWPDFGFEYVLSAMSNLSVANGNTLTLSPGVTLKFWPSTDWHNDNDFQVDGTLVAAGEAGRPVSLTSLRDDSVGGDTNGDGINSDPLAGDWGQLTLTSAGDSRLEYLDLRYGGGDNDGRCCAQVRAADAMLNINSPLAPVMANLAAEHSQSTGAIVAVTGGEAWTLADSRFNHNSATGLILRGDNAPLTLTGIDASGNGEDGILTDTEGTQRITGVSVDNNGRNGLTISTAARVTLDESQISRHASGIGLIVSDAAADSTIDGVNISGARIVASVIPNVLDPLTHDNILEDTARGVYIRSGQLTRNSIWPKRVYDFVVHSDAHIAVGVGTELSIDAGVVLKLGASRDWQTDSSFTIHGQLTAMGTPDEHIKITSINDDEAGGDTNGDGVDTSPLPGDWGRLHFTETASGTLDFVDIAYGGGGNDGRCCAQARSAPSMLAVDVGIAPAFSNISLRQSQSHGAIFSVTGGEGWALDSLDTEFNLGDGLVINGGNAALSLMEVNARGNQGSGMVITTTGPLEVVDSESANNEVDGLVITTNQRLSIARISIVDHGSNAGLIVNNATADSTFDDLTIAGNTIAVRAVPNLIESILADNDIRDVDRGIRVLGGTLTRDTNWASGLVYVFEGDTTITEEAALTLAAGVVVKFADATEWRNDLDLNVAGRLTAQAGQEPVVFTALTDDIGGDTNGDGVASTPAQGRWGRISTSGQADLQLDGAILRYGGGGNQGQCCAATRATDGILSINGGLADIRHSIIEFSQGNGIKVNAGTGVITGNQFGSHAMFGVSFGNVACEDWALGENQFMGNGSGDQEGCP